MVRVAKIMVVLGFLVLCGPAWAVEPNLVSHWKFDEGSGTIAYDSAGSNDGTVYGAVWTTGQVNGALDFDGVDDYVDLSSTMQFDNRDFAITGWFRTDSNTIGTHEQIWNSGYDGDGEDLEVAMKNNELFFYARQVGNAYMRQSAGTANDGTWHHFAALRNGSDFHLYLDGVLSSSASKTLGDLDAAGVIPRIGNGLNAIDYRFFNGSIDDVRIYDRALSAEEIWQLYQAAPVACVVGGDQAIEAGSGCEARVTLDGSCSSDADSTPGTNDDINDFDWYLVDACDPNFEDFLGSGEIIECNLPLGEHVIVLEVTDKADAFDTNEVTIIVEDTTPPEFTLSVATDVLWPPNHKMIEIGLSWVVSDNCDESPDVSLVSITIEGDGAQANDDVQVDPNDGSIYLRAKRSRASGRVYIITYQAADDSGNVTVNSTIVTVPHDRRRR